MQLKIVDDAVRGLTQNEKSPEEARVEIDGAVEASRTDPTRDVWIVRTRQTETLIRGISRAFT